ncbi:MAG: choice-of-anchor X domain-containing protein [Candidatus Binatia bacterium]
MSKDTGTPVDDQSILARTTLEAEFTLPDQSKARLVLFNDGTHGDGGYLDAVWGNSFRDARQEGIYEVALLGEVTFDSGLVRLGPITRALKVVAPINIRLGIDDSQLHSQHRARLTVARLRSDDSVEADPHLLNKARFYIEVTGPGGIRESLSAFDDGKPEHADRMADDGEYSAFLEPRQEGEYRLVGVFETVTAEPGQALRQTARSAVASLQVTGLDAPGWIHVPSGGYDAFRAAWVMVIGTGKEIIESVWVHIGWVVALVALGVFVVLVQRYAGGLREGLRAFRTQATLRYQPPPVPELRRELVFEKTPDGKARPPIQLDEGGDSEVVDLLPGRPMEIFVRRRSTCVRLREGATAIVNGEPMNAQDGEKQLAPETVVEIGDYVLRYREERVENEL